MSLKNDLLYAAALIAFAILFGIANNALRPNTPDTPDPLRQLPWLGSPKTPDQVKEATP